MPEAQVQWKSSQDSHFWQKSHVNWTIDDIRFLNRICGYEKYRVVTV